LEAFELPSGQKGVFFLNNYYDVPVLTELLAPLPSWCSIQDLIDANNPDALEVCLRNYFGQQAHTRVVELKVCLPRDPTGPSPVALRGIRR
jgi:hypothetical protein